MSEFVSKAYTEKTSSIGVLVRLTGKSPASIKTLIQRKVIFPYYDIPTGRYFFSAEDADKALLAFFCKDKLDMKYSSIKHILALFKIYFPEYSVGEIQVMLEKTYKTVQSGKLKY